MSVLGQDVKTTGRAMMDDGRFLMVGIQGWERLTRTTVPWRE
jgi:hypothetical protein